MKAQTDYEARIRHGIIPWRNAERLIAGSAINMRFDAWQLNIEPIDLPIQRRMGIRHPIDIRYKFLHIFPVLLDQNGNELLALHTMPIDPATPDLPDTMGTSGTKIRIFAMTPDASTARFGHEQHKALPPTPVLLLNKPAARAGLLAAFAENIEAANHYYTVPVAPVRNEFMQALANRHTLSRNPVRRTEDRYRRYKAGKTLQALNDTTLVRQLCVHCTQPLGVTGFNSNSGAEALRQLLDYPFLPYTSMEAPFIERSLLAGQDELLARLEQVNRKTEPAAAVSERPQQSWRGFIAGWLPQPIAARLAA